MKYKLITVEDDRVTEICDVGWFNDERDLVIWAFDNAGELALCAGENEDE